jgi:hypothetical protein
LCSTSGESDDHEYRAPEIHRGRWRGRSINGRICKRQSTCQRQSTDLAYQANPMPFDPKSITGISEKVLVSHYENNYVGAVKRLNAIGTQLAELDFAKAANFVINGLTARRIDRLKFDDPARNLFRRARWRRKTRWCVGGGDSA